VNAWIILVGVGALVVLGTLAGLADARARESAWRGIAQRRRANWEEREHLVALLEALVQEAGACPCRGCRMVRRILGRADDPEDDR
jgi:hypothetical protein